MAKGAWHCAWQIEIAKGTKLPAAPEKEQGNFFPFTCVQYSNGYWMETYEGECF